MSPELYLDEKGQLWFTELDRDKMKISYKVKEVLYNGKTEYQDIAIFDLYDYGRSLILDGVVQTTELDSCIYNEMLIHIPAAIHKKFKNVLVIGAGTCGNVKELVKYDSIENIDVVEIDKKVVELCLKQIPSISCGSCDDPRVRFHYGDGTVYMSDPSNINRYDVVFVDSSDPDGPSQKLFQKPFYQNVHKVLKDEGIVVCQSESIFFYKDILSNIRKNLGSIFPIVETYYFPMPCFPGGLWSLTLGSKKFGPADADPDILPENTVFIQKNKLSSYFDPPEAFYKV